MLTLLAISLAIYAFHSSSLIDYTYDDAFISFRYAENLANGHGLVYNIGERVEGYTNFLWTVIIAGAIKLGADPLVVAKILGVVFALATMFLMIPFSALATGRRGWPNALPVLFLACSGQFVAWAQWGLEGGMFTFFITLGLFLFLKAVKDGMSFAYCSLAFVIATLTRPEGIIFFGVSIIYYLLLVRRANRLKDERNEQEKNASPKAMTRSSPARFADLARAVRPVLFPIRIAQLATPFVVIYGIYYGWRFSYYGYPFPNTYYVRMAGTLGAYFQQWVRGLKYISDFLWSGGGVVILVLVALLWATFRPARRSPLSFLSIFCVVPIVYSMHVGGDSKHFYRLLMPYLPLFYILVAESLFGVFRLAVQTKSDLRVRSAGRIVFVGFVAALMCYTYCFPTLAFFAEGKLTFPTWSLLRGRTPSNAAVKGYERQKRLVGEWLRKHAPRRTTIATTVAGVMPYYSKLYTYDMLGVTNEHIAHTAPQPTRIVSVDVKATFPDRPHGLVKNILITSHLKSDNEYIIHQNPTLILEGYDIAFRKAGYKKFRLPTDEFVQYYFAKRPVQFLP